MASKLFRAVVGFGISLGAASAACVGGAGSIEASAADTTTPPGNTWDPPPGSNWEAPGSNSESPNSPASGDARADADAAADAPKDAMLDAFCDAAWPTTKGNPGGPTCGAVDGCGDAGPAPHCYKLASGSSSSSSSSSTKCDPANVTYPAWCISGAWQCSTGSVPADQCQ